MTAVKDPGGKPQANSATHQGSSCICFCLIPDVKTELHAATAIIPAIIGVGGRACLFPAEEGWLSTHLASEIGMKWEEVSENSQQKRESASLWSILAEITWGQFK